MGSDIDTVFFLSVKNGLLVYVDNWPTFLASPAFPSFVTRAGVVPLRINTSAMTRARVKECFTFIDILNQKYNWLIKNAIWNNDKRNSIKHVNKRNRKMVVYVQNADFYSQLDVISSIMFIELDFLQVKKC